MDEDERRAQTLRKDREDEERRTWWFRLCASQDAPQEEENKPRLSRVLSEKQEVLFFDLLATTHRTKAKKAKKRGRKKERQKRDFGVPWTRLHLKAARDGKMELQHRAFKHQIQNKPKKLTR